MFHGSGGDHVEFYLHVAEMAGNLSTSGRRTQCAPGLVHVPGIPGSVTAGSTQHKLEYLPVLTNPSRSVVPPSGTTYLYTRHETRDGRTRQNYYFPPNFPLIFTPELVFNIDGQDYDM
jgi:hypothetical protein